MKDIKIGLFVGSDTGNTEVIASDFIDAWNYCPIDLINAYDMTLDNFNQYEVIILALSTWYDGELQSDFDRFYTDFTTIDFSGKTVALFGLGDQYGYPEYFVDGIGILGEVVLKNGGKIIGMVPSEDYHYEASKGLFNETTFYGLPLDEDNQIELTEERLTNWIKQLEEELNDI